MSLTCLCRLINCETKQRAFILASIPKLCFVQSANLISKERRDPNIKKPAPWPYKTKQFTYLKSFWEGTTKRFDENTKIIVVDGTIGAGKHAVAKQLADAFDMMYIPEPTLESYYITSYGYDLRKLDPILPPSFKSCEISTFYKNPHDPNVPKFQYHMYFKRLQAYLEGLAHLLNTGQGIVMERSAYTDFVFVEAMFDHGLLSKGVRELYLDVIGNTLDELMRPNLIIYLDVSPEVALERIKKKNDPIEVNSPLFQDTKYLESIEYHYKQKYLKEFEKHSEIVVYDWNNYGDVEVVIEDLERIDLDRFTKYDTQMKDWRKEDDWEWGYYRRRYTNEADRIMRYGVIFRPRVTEIYHPTEECIEYARILEQVPGEIYDDGFNPMAGDQVLFKMMHKGYWYLNTYRMPH